jgi:hypothetical protein
VCSLDFGTHDPHLLHSIPIRFVKRCTVMISDTRIPFTDLCIWDKWCLHICLCVHVPAKVLCKGLNCVPCLGQPKDGWAEEAGWTEERRIRVYMSRLHSETDPRTQPLFSGIEPLALNRSTESKDV